MPVRPNDKTIAGLGLVRSLESPTPQAPNLLLYRFNVTDGIDDQA